jgi:C-terminal processing protease CtpA/Prc
VANLFRPMPRLTDLTNGNTWQNMELEWEDEAHLLAPQFAEPSPGISLVKFDTFLFEDDQVEKIVSRANKSGSLVIDLRGNAGGAVDTMRRLVGAMFDHEVKIYDRVTRNGTKTLRAKAGLGHHHFNGKLIVLVDSKSASASEIFARVIQLEKRGIVIGDRSAGAVMESLGYTHQVGSDVVTFYSASVTEANLIMTDGMSLEHTGVSPDELVLPTAADLASGRDPVLAHAVELLGGKLSAEDAGKLFPYHWPKLQ